MLNAAVLRLRLGQLACGLCLSLPPALWAQPLATVDNIDLGRYLGTWREIASIPQFFQRDCARDASAEYWRDGERIGVTNRCTTADGKIKIAQGQARVVDPSSRSKLEVTFVKLFGWLYLLGGDYWVIDLAEDYRYAVVGHPDRTYAWILARAPLLAAPDLIAIEARLRDQGYDTCTLLTSVQTGGLPLRQKLCDAVTVHP